MNKKQTTKQALIWIKLLIPAFMLLFYIPSSALASSIIDQEEKIIELTNEVRERTGATPLTLDSRLMASALQKAQDMAERSYFSHANPDNQRMSYWINNAGYEYSLAGENLARGFSSTDRLIQAWEKSFSHYINLVEPKFQHIGIGIATGTFKEKETVFVVQHFGVEQSTTKNIAGFTDFTLSIMQFIPKATAVTNTLGDSEGIIDAETFIFKSEAISTDGQATEETSGFVILLTIMALAGIGYIVNYTNANRLSRRILLEKSLRTSSSSHN